MACVVSHLSNKCLSLNAIFPCVFPCKGGPHLIRLHQIKIYDSCYHSRSDTFCWVIAIAVRWWDGSPFTFYQAKDDQQLMLKFNSLTHLFSVRDDRQMHYGPYFISGTYWMRQGDGDLVSSYVAVFYVNVPKQRVDLVITIDFFSSTTVAYLWWGRCSRFIFVTSR